MPQTMRRISIKEKHRQLFWETVTAFAQYERGKRGDGNPFLAIHVSDIIIDTVIAMAAAVKNNDQERVAQLQARARSAPTEFSPPLDQGHVRLYINATKKAVFWSALTALANRVLQMRGGRSPFEFVSLSALITGVFLELGGYPLAPDEQVTSPLAMQRLLTISIPPTARRDFWRMLLMLATSKSALEGQLNPFKGIDRSQLVIDLVIAVAQVQQTGDTKPLLALTGVPLQQPDPLSAQQTVDAPTLVLYINEKNQAPFWDALTALGDCVLSKHGSADPFKGISVSALLIDTVLAVGEARGNNDWKRLSNLTDVEEPALLLS